MLVRMGLLEKKEGMAQCDFSRYWREQHGPLVCAALSEMGGYVQNHVTADESNAGRQSRIAGVSQLFYSGLPAMRRSIVPAKLRRLQEDELNFLGDFSVLTAIQNVVIAPPRADAAQMKIMSFLNRRQGVSADAFQYEWLGLGLRATLVGRVPGLCGYRQNLVVEHKKDRFSDTERTQEIGIDGVEEFWFSSNEAFRNAGTTPQWLTFTAHSSEFAEEATTLIVDPFPIISGLV